MSDKHGAAFWFKPGSITMLTHLIRIKFFLGQNAAAVATITVLTMHAHISPHRIMLKITSMPKAHTLAHPAEGEIALYSAFSAAYLAIITVVTTLLIRDRSSHVVISKHAMRFDDAMVEAVSETARAFDGVIAACEDVGEPVFVIFLFFDIVECYARVLTRLTERAVDTKVAINRIMLDILRQMHNSFTLAFVARFVFVGKAAAAVATWA